MEPNPRRILSRLHEIHRREGASAVLAVFVATAGGMLIVSAPDSSAARWFARRFGVEHLRREASEEAAGRRP